MNTIMIIIQIILIIVLALTLILHFAFKDENNYKELLKHILKQKIKDNNKVEEFIKILEIGNKKNYNSRLDLYEISYDYKEEDLFELFFYYNYKSVNKQKLDAYLNITAITNIKVQNIYNLGQQLVLQMDLKEEELERWVYSNLGLVFYKNNNNEKVIKELYNLK